MHLQLKKIDTKGIPIGELWAAHSQFQPKGSLPQNIGDGFLLEFNPIFRKIRKQFTDFGFAFSERDPCRYFAFPLVALDDIYAHGIVPFRDNAFWLQTLSKKMPDITLTELKRSELQFNYLFHESAHFVAHRILFGRRQMNRIPVSRDSLLKILIGESFANTVECFSGLYAEGEIGSFFTDANCHFRLSLREVKILKKSIQSFGFECSLKILFASFLYANYLRDRLTTSEVREIKKFSRARHDFSALSRIAFELSEIFRTNTTQFHLMKLGFPDDLSPWMKADPLRELGKGRGAVPLDRLFGLLLPDSV